VGARKHKHAWLKKDTRKTAASPALIRGKKIIIIVPQERILADFRAAVCGRSVWRFKNAKAIEKNVTIDATFFHSRRTRIIQLIHKFVQAISNNVSRFAIRLVVVLYMYICC